MHGRQSWRVAADCKSVFPECKEFESLTVHCYIEHNQKMLAEPPVSTVTVAGETRQGDDG